MQKEIDDREFFEVYTLKLSTLWNITVPNICSFLMTHVQKFATLRSLVDIATAGRLHGLSTLYIKHNLIHQIKIGGDVELQSTHIALFKSPRDVHQVDTLSIQLGLGLVAVGWMQRVYLLVIYWLICLREQKIPYATAQTVEIFHQSFIYPTTWNIWNDGCTKSFHSLRIPTFFPSMQNSVSKNLFKRTYPISQRVHRQLAAKKIVRSKKKSRPKLQRRNSRTVFKMNNLEAMKESTLVAITIIAHRNNFPLRH